VEKEIDEEGTMKKEKKIIGLSCGRKNGNSEILLKEACMAAEEVGIKTEIIRTIGLNMKPCRGCEACSIQLFQQEKNFGYFEACFLSALW